MKNGNIRFLQFVAALFILISVTSCGPYISLPPYPPSTLPKQPTTPGQNKNASSKSGSVPKLLPSPPPAETSPTIPREETPQYIASLQLVKEAREFALSGKVDTAIDYLERAIELDSYNGDAFYELGRCWEMKGNYDKALTFIDRSIRIFQGRPKKLRRSYLLKAAILKAAGKEEESKKFLDIANSLKGIPK